MKSFLLLSAIFTIVFLSGCISQRQKWIVCMHRFKGYTEDFGLDFRVYKNGSSEFFLTNKMLGPITIIQFKAGDYSTYLNRKVESNETLHLQTPTGSLPGGDECFAINVYILYNTSYGMLHEVEGEITGYYDT